MVRPRGHCKNHLRKDELPVDPHHVHRSQTAFWGGRSWSCSAFGIPHGVGGQIGFISGVKQRDTGETRSEAGSCVAEYLAPSRNRNLQVAVKIKNPAMN